ncbi:M81 family metallopeptidase [Prosthecobacter sp.]|uniref:M81 family metallopeptidase n=1 Tax=Prosthecobacter sp. TaxID=1965333 RepID=UPI0037844219
MPKRILFAGLFHETHTFLDGTSGTREFTRILGEDMLAALGDSSPMGGALEIAREFGWQVLPAADFRASPGALVEDTIVESFCQELTRCAAGAGLDGVFLVLHGAMVSQSFDDVEGEVLERLRRVVGSHVPIFGVFDLHANFTQRMADHANCLVAYRENPHTDARQSAQRAARLLQRCLTTQRLPKMYWQHPPVMWPPTGTATAVEPMLSLEQRARALEAASTSFWVVNVCAGFAFADMADAGVSFVIATTGRESEARTALQSLSSLALEKKAEGNVTEPSVDEVFATLDSAAPGLTVLVEASDNIGGGAPGDGTGMLRALVKHQVRRAAICINDASAVQKLWSHSQGAMLTLPIGGRRSALDEGPLPLKVELLRLSGGRFELEDKQSHLASMFGDHYSMGPCAVVRHRGITILLTTQSTPPFDLAQWRSQGFDPASFDFIVVKAAVAHRRAYDPIAARMLWVDTPGPCSSNLKSLPFRKVSRPIYPLDS